MSDKTEPPTAKKLRDARKKGQVAKSKDFTQTLLIGAIFAYFLAAGGDIAKDMADLILLPSTVYGMDFQRAVVIVGDEMLKRAIALVAPLLLLVIVVGVMGELMQTGILFAFEALKPSGKKLNVMANLKNMFAIKSLIEFAKNNLKVIFLSILIYTVIADGLNMLVRVPPSGVAGIQDALSQLVRQIMIYTAAAFLIVGAFDFAYQRLHHIKGLRMSKDEVKREYKEAEGDPHIKSHRRHLHQELLVNDSVERSRKASVVVTNPTHIAVALYHKQGETPLPVVLSKATGLIAKRIMAVAQEEGIPVMQNIPLARALYGEGVIDQYIPSELIEPVAEILRWAQQFKDG